MTHFASNQTPKNFLYSSNMEDCSDMTDPTKVGTLQWTSGGKTINSNGSTTMHRKWSATQRNPDVQ